MNRLFVFTSALNKFVITHCVAKYIKKRDNYLYTVASAKYGPQITAIHRRASSVPTVLMLGNAAQASGPPTAILTDNDGNHCGSLRTMRFTGVFIGVLSDHSPQHSIPCHAIRETAITAAAPPANAAQVSTSCVLTARGAPVPTARSSTKSAQFSGSCNVVLYLLCPLPLLQTTFMFPLRVILRLTRM